MKWLLISNNGNPGDIWVRLGIQQIIQRLDPEPKFLVRERDYRKVDPYGGLTEPVEPLEFDHSVICGMPLLWYHKEPSGEISSTTQHASWVPLTGWCSSNGRMIIAGFGILLFCPENQHQWSAPDKKVIDALSRFFKKCRLVYSRSPIVSNFFPNVYWLHCPSVLALPQGKEKDLKLANFMPGGGHYPGMAPKAAKKMEQMMPDLAKRLIDEGYHFAAHRNAERDLALDLGWPADRIFTWRSGGKLLEVYARCSKYFGNRIHGAIMSRAGGAEVTVIGYDTRLSTCAAMGCYTFTPLEFPDVFKHWISAPPTNRLPYDINRQWKSHLSWWSTRLRLPIRDKA